MTSRTEKAQRRAPARAGVALGVRGALDPGRAGCDALAGIYGGFGMIVPVRTARPAIILNGNDYYSSLAPYLLSFTYTDSCDGKKADDLGFELADRDGKFISTWMPEKGAFLDASIIATNWFMPYAGGLSARLRAILD